MRGREWLSYVKLPPSKPFMDEIGKQGLPWHMREMKAGEQKELWAVRT